MKTTCFAFIALFIFIGCSKKNEIPANSSITNIQIKFPDGRSYTCSDYSVEGKSGGWPFIIDGKYDTLMPVGFVNLNNLYAGVEFYTNAFTGIGAGKFYSLYFSTPTQFNNNNIHEEWDPRNYQSTISCVGASNTGLNFLDSNYHILQVDITTNVTDTTNRNIYGSFTSNGSFRVSLYPDSVFTASSRVAYKFSTPIEVSGTYTNVIFR
jgi:hypothetical protein